MIKGCSGAFSSKKRGIESISNIEEEEKKAEAAKKIYRCMSDFQARRKGFHEDADYIKRNIQSPATEKLIPKFLQREWPLVEFSSKKKAPSDVEKSMKVFFCIANPSTIWDNTI